MDVLRITESCGDTAKREIYCFLEKLGTFTLIECKNRRKLSLNNLTNTLVLDHFDKSSDPSRLLKQITNSQLDIATIILVDSDDQFSTPVMAELGISAHVIFDSYHDIELKTRSNSDKHDLLIELIQRTKEMAA